MLFHSKDNLGSIVAITDQTGAVTQRLSYDPWGKRRYPNGTADPNGLLNNPDMYHGYTGHEHVDEAGIIHMNGRLYDPVMARFLSADPHIQDPLNLQSYNRYSYCWGNPLNSTDPSGYFSLKGFFKAAAAIAVAVYAPNFIATSSFGVSVAGATELSAMTVGAITAGAISGAISTGNIQGVFQGGLTAGMFDFVGANVIGSAGSLPKVLAHAAVGCVSASMGGGGCGSGTLSAGFAEFAGPKFGSNWGEAGKTIKYAVLGGAASVLGGGKFTNGAMTGAFAYAFNNYAHPDVTVDEYGNGSIGNEAKASWNVDGSGNYNGSTFPDDPTQYPVVREGTYKYTVKDYKGYKALLLNDGGGVPIMQAINPVTGALTADRIWVHKGFNNAYGGQPAYKGSQGCLTVNATNSKNYANFIGRLKDGQSGTLVLTRH